MDARLRLLVFYFCVTITLFEVIGKRLHNVGLTANILLSAATTNKKPIQCNTSKECGLNQCCANIDKLKGRKKRSTGIVCKPYAIGKSECAVRNQNATRDVFLGWCPCSKPFDCVGTGITDPPYGELGVCRYRFKDRPRDRLLCLRDGQC